MRYSNRVQKNESVLDYYQKCTDEIREFIKSGQEPDDKFFWIVQRLAMYGINYLWNKRKIKLIQ